MEMATLQGAGPNPGAFAKLLHDDRSGEWHLLVSNLGPPAAGRTYEAWFITPDQRKLPAGTFDVSSTGEGTLVMQPPEGETIALVAVTDEPHGGVEVPTGQIHLVGAPKAAAAQAG